MADARGVLLLAAALLSSCGDEPEPGRAAPEPADVPFQRVLDDQVSVSPDGSRVLADCWNGICTWDAATGALTLVPDRNQVAVAPDWSTVVTIDGGDVVLESLETGAVEQTLTGLDDAEVADGSAVTAVAYSPDGSQVAAAGAGGEVLVWSVADGSEVASLTASYDARELAFSPDGARLATAGGGPVEVHDVASASVVATPGAGESAAVAWSPDGRWLAGADVDGVPAVWETEDFEPVADLPGVRLRDLAFSPDSATLALAALDTTAVRLWRPDGGVKELLGHTDDPGAVAWSPGGRSLYSVGADDGVLAWNLPRGLPTPLEVPAGPS